MVGGTTPPVGGVDEPGVGLGEEEVPGH